MTTITGRETLGPYMSLICFQYLRNGTEEVADRAPVIAAGRNRGHDAIAQLSLLGASHDPAFIKKTLSDVLGENGTRLCLVTSITGDVEEGYEVRLIEGACTAGQTSSEPVCAFTLGVFIGAISAITGVRMRGVETACSACGSPECVYQISPI